MESGSDNESPVTRYITKVRQGITRTANMSFNTAAWLNDKKLLIQKWETNMNDYVQSHKQTTPLTFIAGAGAMVALPSLPFGPFAVVRNTTMALCVATAISYPDILFGTDATEKAKNLLKPVPMTRKQLEREHIGYVPTSALNPSVARQLADNHRRIGELEEKLGKQ